VREGKRKLVEAKGMNDLSNRHVVVIGGSSGMGYAIAQAVLAEGARVTVASSNEARSAAAATRLGPGVAAAVCDLASPASIARFFADVSGIDHLVITAQAPNAVATIQPLSQLRWADAEAVFSVKFFGTLRAVRAAQSKLAKDGSIVLVSGAASRRTIAGHVLLGGLNAAVEGAARQLAKELAPIRVNVISPGLVRSDAYAAMPQEQREAMYAARAKVLPVGRVGAPADIALAAIHLMKNGYVTGVVQDIDGGGLLG
jgi:NAD(P)-dependent dehydrogenase (short-subunit alcohol dehydrogenase family)